MPAFYLVASSWRVRRFRAGGPAFAPFPSVPSLQIEDSLVQRIAHPLADLRKGSQTEGTPERAASDAPSTSAADGLATGACAEHLLREQPEVLAFILAGTAQLASETR